MSGSDAQLGRIAAGLPVSDATLFARLPPHFAELEGPTQEQLRSIFPAYQSYPLAFLPVLSHLVASLIYVRIQSIDFMF